MKLFFLCFKIRVIILLDFKHSYLISSSDELEKIKTNIVLIEFSFDDGSNSMPEEKKSPNDFLDQLARFLSCN